MMADMAVELKKHNIAAVSLWPGAARTETITDIQAGKHGERRAKRVCFKDFHICKINVDKGFRYN